MLTIKDLKKTYGGRVLFEDATIQINYGERVALVGPNGAGKTTLFSIILREEESDAGEVIRDDWTTIGFLPQEAEADGDETVLGHRDRQGREIEELEKTMEALEAEGKVDVIDYYEAQGKYERLTDPGLEAKAKGVLRGLGYKEEDLGRAAREMSGGWVMRAHLARILAMEPDLLMLDEPTNHLDLVSLLWLQDYLKTYNGALLMISHDRVFMDEVIQKVYDIEEQKLIAYKGNYSDFERLREERFQQRHKAWQNQQKEIEKTQKFINEFRSVSSKASQVQSRIKQLEKMDKVEKPRRPKKPFRFQIPEPPRGGQHAVTLEGIHQAYGDHKVYEGLDLMIERGERTVLVGPNGAGKSTLLKILAGVLEFQEGTRKLGHNAKIGYFSQHRSDTLDDNKTVLQEVMDAAPEIREQDARGILGSFLFRKDDIYKKTSVLSGGEKSRLNLVKFLVDPPNLLLMDEPTTHLDILSVESLILALGNYAGTLVFISHDVHFIRKLATKTLHVKDGQAVAYHGGYDYFLEKSGGLDEREALTA